MRGQLLLGAFAAWTMVGVAVAQTNPPANPPASTTSPSVAPNPATQGGMQAAQPGAVVVHFVTVKPADVLSSRLIGTNVRNKQDESVGEIEDLVIENGKTITALVIGVGGFLGLGERYVAVDPASVVLTRVDDNTWRAVIDTNKENLKNAPTFDYHKRG